MKIFNHLKWNGTIDDFANLMVYPTLDTNKWPTMTVWHCRTIDGEDLDNCCEFNKEDAIKKAKEYLLTNDRRYLWTDDMEEILKEELNAEILDPGLASIILFKFKNKIYSFDTPNLHNPDETPLEDRKTYLTLAKGFYNGIKYLKELHKQEENKLKDRIEKIENQINNIDGYLVKIDKKVHNKRMEEFKRRKFDEN